MLFQILQPHNQLFAPELTCARLQRVPTMAWRLHRLCVLNANTS
jgi:hypothetical protein